MAQSWGSQYLLLGTNFFSYAQIAAFFIALFCVTTVEFILRKTRWGQDIRAVADDAEAAELVGLDTHRINTGAFALSCAIAAVAGSVLITYYPVNPETGFTLMPITLIATVVGGLGSVVGAFLGGIACGVISQVAGAVAGPALQDVPLYVREPAVALAEPGRCQAGGRRRADRRDCQPAILARGQQLLRRPGGAGADLHCPRAGMERHRRARRPALAG
jgi:branched-chain amino acid transport system permease protein